MHTPYRDAALDALYHGLFADDVDAFVDRRQPRTAWGRALVAEPADSAVLRALALAPDTESRVAALAWGRLRELGQPVPRRQLLGVVIEVPLDSGLDTLAAYHDGSVRFIHGSGSTTLVEAPNTAMRATVQRLLVAAQAVVDRIGPSDRPRGPAPQSNVRINFLVSDGLYFGEGPMLRLMGDGLAGPVLQAGVALLDQVTACVAA